MPKKLDDVVNRLWEVAQLLYIQDYFRESSPAACDKENSEHRGLILTILSPKEFEDYADIRTEFNPPLNVFDPQFISDLSAYQTATSDRSRVIVPSNDRYALIADCTIKDEARRAAEIFHTRNPECFKNFEGIASYLEREEFTHLDRQKIFQHYLGDAADGDGGTRLETALNLAVVTEKPVIITRTRVVPQSTWDYKVDMTDPLTQEPSTVLMSRLGMGEVLQIGPYGLQRRALLRIAPESKPSQCIGTVTVEEQNVPVALEIQHYHSGPAGVHRMQEEPAYKLVDSLPTYHLRS
ncbi:MAG: hypothetical protein HC945_02005 [Nitrosarchaeum sp.]|nr:hypothetical protein [Nitrosarchaeum sp.]